MRRLITLLQILACTLPAVALAEQACPAPRLLETLPRAGQTGVPTDAQVVLRFDFGCFELGTSGVTLHEGGRTLTTSEATWASQGQLNVALVPMEPMAASTEHTIRSSAGDIRFTTGTSTAAGPSDPPVVRIIRAEFDPDATPAIPGLVFVDVDLQITPADDPSGLAFVHFFADGDAISLESVRHSVPAKTRDTTLSIRAPSDALCIAAVQQDAAGRFSVATRVCVPPTPVPGLHANGCACLAPNRARPGITVLLGLLGGLALARRRRRHCHRASGHR